MRGAAANGARWLAGAAAVAQLALSGCGGGGGGDSAAGSVSTAPTNAFSLNATINGLDTSGLVLTVNGASVAVPSGATTQMLASSLASGTAYSVSVATQPTGETCSVSSNSGTIGSANSSVVVTCSAQAYTLGGTINGLSTAGLVLANGGATLTVTSGSKNFEFATPIADGSPYDVMVQTQPLGLTCTLTNNAGTMGSGNVTNLVVSCASNTYTVGGSITGLSAAGLVLQDNGGDSTSIDANAPTFVMLTSVAYGGHYAVTAQSQPTGLVCTVSNGSGTMGAANVTSITIACLPNTKIVYAFAGYPASGLSPYGALIQGTDGNLYGTTEAGGASDLGTVFMIDPGNGTASLLHSFTGSPSDGATPYAGLMQDSHGNLYGTAEAGGVYQSCFIGYNCDFIFGTIFEIAAATGTESTVHSFEGDTSPFLDGSYPYAGLLEVSSNAFYGTTQKGGGSGNGTVFKINAANGAETMVHAFAGGSSDGAAPYAGLTLASDGNLYGTTQQGGANAAGTVFKVNPGSGVETIVYSFAGGTTDGASPYGGVIQAKDGNLYGTTGSGGAHGDGAVFRIAPSTGAETLVYSFAGGSDGANPYAGLMQATDGNLYGTTVGGGAGNDGTVFRVTPATGAESVVYAFAGGSSDGAAPYGGLIQGSDGNLYGTTTKGGSSDAGTVFRVSIQ